MIESNLRWAIVVLVLLAVEILYFYLARHFNILDKPNDRSSHTQPIIRGGGVIFPFSVMLWFFQSGFQWHWFLVAVVLIALISFIDDLTSLHPAIRFLIQALAIVLVFFQLSPFSWPWYLLISAGIVMIGTLNAFNFMDGINGITGIYALVMLVTLAWVQQTVVSFTDINLIIYIGLSVAVFLFFNFRSRAKCFAGDVGSVSIALILVFLLLQLITATNNFLWPLLFLVYGTDSIITIGYRLKRRENIFKPHRTHLYQYLVNELGWQHRTVSLLYGITQGVVNVIVLPFLVNDQLVIPVLVALVYIACYLFVRMSMVRRITILSRLP